MGKSRKRKHSRDSQDYILRKIRKLEKRINRCRSPSYSSEYSDRDSSASKEEQPLDQDIEVLPSPLMEKETASPAEENSTAKAAEGTGIDETPEKIDSDKTSAETLPEGENKQETEIDNSIIDGEILEILGEDPSTLDKRGPDLHKEVTRFEYWATSGLTKENRKELNEKYLIPGNCARIGAPLINPEIKAALSDTVVKRDKVIEFKQKQLASAISCVGGAISQLINTKEKDNVLLGQLLDAGRLMCDLQYTESVTRRNFAFFSVKKEFKDQLLTTKIDKHLFGENLAEVLKTAKAVSKSATDMKVDTRFGTKIQKKTQKPLGTRDLNSKAPAPTRRQSGPARSLGPASRRHLPASSSKTSSSQQRPYRG